MEIRKYILVCDDLLVACIYRTFPTSDTSLLASWVDREGGEGGTERNFGDHALPQLTFPPSPRLWAWPSLVHLVLILSVIHVEILA